MRRFIQMTRSALAWAHAGSEEGVAAIEYGLMAALIAMVIIAAVITLGTNLTGLFDSIAAQIHS